MPYKIRKLPNKDLYRVYNSKTKKVHSKSTSKEKAIAQLKFLRGLEHGWKPKKKSLLRKKSPSRRSLY